MHRKSLGILTVLLIGIGGRAVAGVADDCNAFARVAMEQKQEATDLQCGFPAWMRTNVPAQIKWC